MDKQTVVGFAMWGQHHFARRNLFVLPAIFALVVFGWPKFAFGTVTGSALELRERGLPVTAIKAIKKPVKGARCVRAYKTRSGFSLKNRCSLCRSVQIQHRRPDNRPPILRDYYMPPGKTLRLPFRGKGRTRVLSDVPCDSNDKRAKSIEKSSQSCVRIRPGGKGLVMVNACSVCKAGIVERVFRDGSRRQQTLAIQAKGYVPINANGATQARLISETPCR